jgi:hypothetical protein
VFISNTFISVAFPLFLFIGIAFTFGGDYVNLPYEFTIARLSYAFAFLILIIKTGYWLAFERGNILSPIAALVVACIIFAGIGGAWILSTLWVADRENAALKKHQLPPIQNFEPNLDIKLFLSHFPSPQRQREYILQINNINPQSAIITDFRMKLVFKNKINKVNRSVLPDTGQPGIEQMKVHKKGKNRPDYDYEELPNETSLAKHFTLNIQRAKINKKLTNTNSAILTCDIWPEKAAFTANIVIDLTKEPEFPKKDKPGTYTGMYFYQINDQSARIPKNISGVIPDAE